MSDTHSATVAPVAPAVGMTPQPAGGGSSPNEAPINPNPVSSPSPITNTPPGVIPNTGRGSHRHDVIAKAFERANEGRLERKGAAEAKMGHNRPPEAMEKAKEKTPLKKEGFSPSEKIPPLDLKKRPADQPEGLQDRAGPIRDATGRYVRNTVQSGVQSAQKPQSGQTTGMAPDQTAPTRLPEGVPWRDPLPRMSERARAEWSKAPESIRADVHRMHQEFSRAYQHMRGAWEAMRPIKPYWDLAREHGTSLDAVLGNYTGIERKLRENPIGALDNIVYNLNLQTSEGRRITLQDVAYHVLNMTPEQHQLRASENTQQALRAQLQEIRQAQEALAQQQRDMAYRQQFGQTRGAVDRFAETHPRFDELGDLIKREIDLGFDLPTAYARANLLRPATSQRLPTAAQTRATAPQTRTSDRSISGAPDGGSANGALPRKSVDRRGSVANAIRRANGSL